MARPTQPVYRFAPSPNGYLHLGHAYSAILNFDLAMAAGGRFLLRIEDIDATRSRAEYVQAIGEDLAWLGLRWETPVRRQSEHFALYAGQLAQLARQALVYPCFCSRADLQRFAAARPAWPRDPDGSPLYGGTCRQLAAVERDRRIAAGEPHCLRLDSRAAIARLKNGLNWHEVVDAGGTRLVEANPAQWGDVALGRKDVPASYHLAVVTDDALQNVTHVVRGLDLFAATSLHRLLQELLSLPAPLYQHHRLILDADQQKLSKSGRAQSLRALRASGASPAKVRRLVGL
jgi:glutamyl-Q tRNA(Asp) synthetase